MGQVKNFHTARKIYAYFLALKNSNGKSGLKNSICNFSIEQLKSTFKHFETLEIDIPLSRERSSFILRLIELRHEKLREVLI